MEQPFHIDRLCDETRKATRKRSEAIHRLKAAGSRMQVNIQALFAALEQSRRLLDGIKDELNADGRR